MASSLGIELRVGFQCEYIAYKQIIVNVHYQSLLKSSFLFYFQNKIFISEI